MEKSRFVPRATRVRYQRLAQRMPGIPGDLYDALRRRGISPQAIRRHRRELIPQARFLLVDRVCTFIRWTESYDGVYRGMIAAPKALFVVEVTR